MNKKYHFDSQQEAIGSEISKLIGNGLQLPDLTEDYENDFGKALPIPFEDAFQILASTKRNYFRLKTQELNLYKSNSKEEDPFLKYRKSLNMYDSSYELKDLPKLFSKYRTKSVIGCFPYTSARYPWPVNSAGDAIPPMLQLDLSMLCAIGMGTFGDGLLQVFASNFGEYFRIIPAIDVRTEEMDNTYLLNEEMNQDVLERFVTTHRVIKDLYTAGTVVNQRMASRLRCCLREFFNDLDSDISAKYKKLISLFDNVVHDDPRRGSYMFGWGWNYNTSESFDDCFMQLEGPEFDFNHDVMSGCGCLRYSKEGDFILDWNSYY